jgi:hypothetical protein
VARVASARGRRLTRGTAVPAPRPSDARGAAQVAAQTQSLPRHTPAALLDRIRQIVHTLDEHPGMTAPELAERIEFGRRHTSLMLLRLQEHGHVVPDGQRWFSVH